MQIDENKVAYGRVMAHGRVVALRPETPVVLDERLEEVLGIIRGLDPRGMTGAARLLDQAVDLGADGPVGHIVIAVLAHDAARLHVAHDGALPAGHLEDGESLAGAAGRIALGGLGVPVTLNGWRSVSVDTVECRRARRHVTLVADTTAWETTGVLPGVAWRQLANMSRAPQVMAKRS